MKRMFKWFARHKVTAVFAVLVLAFALWFLGSMLVWNVQVHFERERFNGAYDYLAVKEHFANSPEIPAVSYIRHCSYRGDTGFGRKWLGCQVGADAVYLGVTKQEAQALGVKVGRILNGDGIKLSANPPSEYFHEVLSYSFPYQRLDCELRTQYYGEDIPSYAAYEGAVTNSAKVSIRCTGDAKAEYFPVTNN